MHAGETLPIVAAAKVCGFISLVFVSLTLSQESDTKTVYLEYVLNYIDEKTGKHVSDLDLANMILNVNFAAVANSSNGVAQALLYAAKHPDLA